MRSISQLTVVERLDRRRRNRRAVGAAAAGAAGLVFAWSVVALYAGYYYGAHRGAAGLAGWAIAYPLPALLVVAAACLAAGWAAVAIAYQPPQRRLVFDRASVYVVSGRDTSRHALVLVRLDPDAPEGPTMYVGDQAFGLEPRDLMRVAGLLRVVIQPRSRKARPVAACNPTVIEHPPSRPRPRIFVTRHPTGVA